MEIKANSSYGPVPLGEAPPARRPAAGGGDVGEFTTTQALQEALEQTPDVRPEAVARGQALVANDHYPPPETIRRLAVLFAIEFSGSSAADLPRSSTNSTPETTPTP
jgi:hypothetical protein